jgi:hypothetical protein
MERGVLHQGSIAAPHGDEQLSYLCGVTINLVRHCGDQIAPLTSHVDAPEHEPYQ